MMDTVVLVIGQMGGIVDDGYSGFNDRWWVV